MKKINIAHEYWFFECLPKETIWSKSVRSKFKIFSNHIKPYIDISLQESQNADMSWSVILEIILHKCINPLDVWCFEIIWNKRGMDRPPERRDGSRQGWWKPLRFSILRVVMWNSILLHKINVYYTIMCCNRWLDNWMKKANYWYGTY